VSFTEVEGDIFEMNLPAIGHGCNCEGVMGAGIASDFKARWPKMYQEYRQYCLDEEPKPGDFYPYPTAEGVMIFNLFTQRYPGADARVEWIESAVSNAVAYCREEGIDVLGIPRIGCGIGGLKWADVKPALQSMMLSSNIELKVVNWVSRTGPHPDVAHLSAHRHPLLQVDQWLPGSGQVQVMGKHREVDDPQIADLITSRIIPGRSITGRAKHTIMLDLDVPAAMVPSSTEGHHHLYIDVPTRWDDYEKLLNLLAGIGIIEKGYARTAIQRGYTALRLPWVRKDSPPT
jgi:O-acetyl-ADP-ribose deacetylase (regulator of RNase III)